MTVSNWSVAYCVSFSVLPHGARKFAKLMYSSTKYKPETLLDLTISSSLTRLYMLSISPKISRLLSILALASSVSACQTTLNKMHDCKAGDWGVIGNKDGEQGYDPRYEERRQFCAVIDSDKIKAESATNYQAGWGQGNFQYWRHLGVEDGRAAHALAYFETQALSTITKKNHTPLNQAAYQQGWVSGNADYWRGLGDQDGVAGKPASAENVRAMEGQSIGFNRISYLEGWQAGNQAYWTRLGYLDAHEGVPDSEFKKHDSIARKAGVQVQEAAYLSAWNQEIIEYWKRLGWDDATQGRDVNTRRADARQRGLKFSELEYKQRWEQRLIQYWQEAGRQDGFGKPNQLEQRMANARADNVFVIAQTRDLYQQAWSAQNARYCSVDNAFLYGRKNNRMAVEVCVWNQQNRVRRAWDSGQEYEIVLRKQREHHEEIAHLLNRRSDAERRLEQIERNIKRDQEDKNRVTNNDTNHSDRAREHERQELREYLHRLQHQIEELRNWDFRYEQQLQQIGRDIYLN